MQKIEWPKGPTQWIEDRTLFVSVPFTWNLPAIKDELSAGSLLWDAAKVGGPAVALLPRFLDGLPNVTVGGELPGILQRVNPLATRTTVGCTRRCQFCGIGRQQIEPGPFRELADWPDLPVICDNNLLASSRNHFEAVVIRLARWGWADFNQGLDCRLMTPEFARLLHEIQKPMIRLALDADGEKEPWEHAFGLLRHFRIAKSAIRSYCLIGFEDTPADAWRRCEWVENHGVKALPMWFHRLDQLEPNIVTPDQEAAGWTDTERKRLMQWFYQHRAINRLKRGAANASNEAV